jgi:hypothetical protein
MRKRSLIAIITILIGASLVFTWSTSAHSIDLKTAREAARNYARGVRDQSGGKYAHYSTNCVRAFPNHNHYVRCIIDYQSASDAEKGVYTCRESVELYLDHHDGGISGVGSWRILGKHTSRNQCGSQRLSVTFMN